MHEANFKAGALELGAAVEGSTDIALLGTEKVLEFHDLGKDVELDTSIFNSDTLAFKNMIGLGCLCYYILDEYYLAPTEIGGEPVFGERASPAIVRERGVGQVIEKDGSYFLQRDKPIMWYNAEGDEFLLDGTGHVHFGVGDYILVGSIIPPTYAEALITPHSIIASTMACDPTPVHLKPSSVVGRKDDRVQAIDMDELSEMIGDRFFSQLAKSQKQLNMQVRHLRLQRKGSAVIAPILRTLPVYSDTNKPTEVEGNIIYNVDSNHLECFDGTKWRKILWEDD